MMMTMSLLLRLLALSLTATLFCDAFAIRIPPPPTRISNCLLHPSSKNVSPCHSLHSRRKSAAFLPTSSTARRSTPTILFQSSFAADGSEYSSKDDFDNDDNDLDDLSTATNTDYEKSYLDYDQDDTPTTELTPVPMSKNSGNRFVAFVWDREIVTSMKNKKNQKTSEMQEELDALDLHYNRIALTEQHVMYCRKANLYNETFNTESMVDVLWSLPILASDLQRVIGHAMCLESLELKHVQDFLRNEPIIQMLTGGNLDDIPLYRWRHLRDYSLRMDDGRFGYPCMCLAMDADAEDLQAEDNANLRDETRQQVLEYWIQSKRIIAAGALHLPTEFKNDPSSIAVGDLMLFNAQDRNHAIQFAEDLPSAQQGLYQDMRVYFYNNLDITGKFVSEDPLRDSPCEQLKEAMEVWGYPVSDEQTPHLNW